MKLFFILISVFFKLTLSFSQGTWTQKANVFTIPRAGVVGFSIGNKGYFGTGWQIAANNYFSDFWEWDKATEVWTQKADFPGDARGDAAGFSIGNFGYIGTGKITGGNFTNDFWQWDQTTNTWSIKSSLPGVARAFAIGFSIGTKGYIGIGGGGTTYLKDFWEWDQQSNTWTQKTDFPGDARVCAVGFAIGTKGYIGTGRTSSDVLSDFWEWNQATDTWVQKANFPGSARAYAAGFPIEAKGYIGTGADMIGNVYDDFYEWDQSSNTWTQKANYPHPVSDIDRASFNIGCKGYLACGSIDPGGGKFYNDFWEYLPDNLPPPNAIITPNTTICSGSSVSLSASGGTTYLWNTGETISSITVSPTVTTTYSVKISSECSSTTISTAVTAVPNAIASFSYEYDPCKSNCVQFTDKSLNAFKWCWIMGDSESLSVQNPCWEYPSSTTYNASLIINCNTMCADTFSLDIPYDVHDSSTFVYIPNAFSPNDDGDNDKLRFFIKDDYCIKEFDITIYNSIGEKIFQTDNPHQSWDGTFNEQKLNSAAFVYSCKIITASGRSVIRKGNVTLVR